jgi:hypothetical protein
VSPDDRQPWELADEEGRPGKKVPPTSKPVEDEDERGDAEPRTHRNGAPSWNEGEETPVPEEEKAPQYADEEAEDHSDPKGPAGGAGGPR